MKVIEVWRWPVRVMHWSMVTAFVVAMVTRDSELQRMTHVYAGYAMGLILTLRIIYGFVANDLAAFRRFPPSLTKGTKYAIDLVMGRAHNHLGHNPAGALAIYAMLGIGLTSVATGYLVFEYDFDYDMSLLKDWHSTLSYAWLWLIGLHLFGVLMGSLAHREFLVKAMITGCKNRRSVEEPFSLQAAGMTVLILVLRVFIFIHVMFGGKEITRRK